MSNEILIAKTPKEINFWHLCSLRGALRQETVGMKRRGASALSIAKREFNLKRNTTAKEALAVVQAEIDRLLEEKHQ